MTRAKTGMIPPTSLSRSLAIQKRVIGALLMREIITRYGRHNIGFLWLFVEPMIFTLGVTILWNLAGGAHGGKLPITAFAITGYSAILLWRNTVGKCIVAITPNLSLMYHRNVQVIDVFASRIFLEIIGATISFFVLTIIFGFIGWVELPSDLPNLLFGWIMLAWLGASLGLTLGALSERSDLVVKFWSPVSYILFPMSGAAFMVDCLPPSAQEAVLLIPFVHGTELIREGYFGGIVHPHYDVTYLFIWCLFLTFLGLAVARETGRRLEPQ